MWHHRMYLLNITIATSGGCSLPEPEPIRFGSGETATHAVHSPDAGTPEVEDKNAAPARNERQATCVPSPPNLLRNGAFEYRPIHACGWETFDAADWGVIAAQYCYDERPGCSVYLASEVWGDHHVAQFYQRVILEPGLPYVFTFEAKAAGVARPLLVSILGGGPLRDQYDDLDLGAGVELDLGLEWRTYVFSFVATEDAKDSIVDFAIGGADTGLYLDNVMLVREPPPVATAADGGT